MCPLTLLVRPLINVSQKRWAAIKAIKKMKKIVKTSIVILIDIVGDGSLDTLFEVYVG